MYVDLIGDAVELVRQVLDRRLYEDSVRKPAFGRLPRRFHRWLLERFRVRIDPDEKLVRIFAGRSEYKASVSGPDIDHDPFAGTGQ